MAKANTPVATYDAIVIGAGQAGPPRARRLAAAGIAVAVIERAAFGGTCITIGCIPTPGHESGRSATSSRINNAPQFLETRSAKPSGPAVSRPRITGRIHDRSTPTP